MLGLIHTGGCVCAAAAFPYYMQLQPLKDTAHSQTMCLSAGAQFATRLANRSS